MKFVKRKSLFKKLYVVIGIVVLLVISIYADLSITKSNKYSVNNPTYPPPPTPIVTEYALFPKPTDNPTTASWKTYISGTVGYSFKAPADWNVISMEADKNKGYGQFDYNFVFTPKVVGIKQPAPDDDTFAVVQMQFPGTYEFTNINSESIKTTIEGRTTYTTKSVSALNPPTNFRGSWCSGCSEKDVYIDAGYNGVRLPIVARWNKGVYGFEALFDQMVATIHFTRSKFIWNAPPIYK